MRIITIPNLDKYQHYKDREGLPWIKWHRKCLNDYKFCQLTDRERWIFIGLILLATENDNKIPADFHYIVEKICYSPPRMMPKVGENGAKTCEKGARMVRKNFSPMRGFSECVVKLIDLKLIAIKRIAKCYQDAILDKSRVDKIREDKIREDKKQENSILNKFFPIRGRDKEV